MSSYAKGRRLEYLVRDLFHEKGYVVIRAARSKPIDLVCMRNGKTLLVECKTNRSNLTKGRKKELLRLAEASGASLILAFKNKRNIEFIDLKNDSPCVL
jgi:Holliday junction resolvase